MINEELWVEINNARNMLESGIIYWDENNKKDLGVEDEKKI